MIYIDTSSEYGYKNTSGSNLYRGNRQMKKKRSHLQIFINTWSRCFSFGLCRIQIWNLEHGTIIGITTKTIMEIVVTGTVTGTTSQAALEITDNTQHQIYEPAMLTTS